MSTNTVSAIENHKPFRRETDTFNRVGADLVLQLSVQNRDFPKIPTDYSQV